MPVGKTEAEVFDVIVLGAGPAGCAASISAQRTGMRVLMLDISSRPKNSPGETLHPGIEPLLKQLGVFDQVLQADFKRHRGIWLQRGNSREFFPYGEDENGPWLGFQVDREIFHRILQQAAVDAKATLIRNCNPEALLQEGNRVIGVIANSKHFQATWTVDATGRSSWLARKLELALKKYSPPLGVQFGWKNENPKVLDSQPSFEFLDDGWDWKAPISDNRIAWVKLRIGKSGSRPPEGIDLTWKFYEECAGPGFFLLGDAAASLDPSASHGVLRALMSGIFFGHLVKNCPTLIDETSITETYRAWFREQFENDEKHLRQRYLESPAGRQFMA